MYYSKIHSADVAMRSLKVADASPDVTTSLFGLLVLIVGLPLLVVRFFLWGMARDIRRVGKLGGIVGQSFIEAARDR